MPHVIKAKQLFTTVETHFWLIEIERSIQQNRQFKYQINRFFGASKRKNNRRYRRRLEEQKFVIDENDRRIQEIRKTCYENYDYITRFDEYEVFDLRDAFHSISLY